MKIFLKLAGWLKAKKWRLILALSGSLVIIFSLVFFFEYGRLFPALGVSTYKYEPAEKKDGEKLYPSPLAGNLVASNIAKRRPIGVMIENASFGSRPQSGLDKADWIFEALAEGGITRFYVVFQSKDVDELGPVRSARPYYVSWGAGLRAAYTHIGQSPEAQDLLRSLGDGIVPDINFGFRFNSGYTRVNWRAAPHNVYTATGNIRGILSNIGQDVAGDWPAYAFKDDLAESLRPDAPANPVVNFRSNGALYKANYVYDKSANSYKRFLAGEPHVDKVTGAQLVAKNVLVLYHPTPGGYPSGHGRLNVNTLAGGRALLFRDGQVYELKWTKAAHKDKHVLTLPDGNEAILNRGGTTWVDIVFPSSTVSY